MRNSLRFIFLTVCLVLLVAPAFSQTVPTQWDYYGTVLEPGPDGSVDAWLNESVSPVAVVEKDGTYFMYYIGADGPRRKPHGDVGPRHRRLCVATSSDLVNWDKYSGNPVLVFEPYAGVPNDYGYNGNDEEGIFSGAATVVDGEVVLFFGGMEAHSIHSTQVSIRVYVATSPDGFNFTNRGLAFEYSGDEAIPLGCLWTGAKWVVYHTTNGWYDVYSRSNSDYLNLGDKTKEYDGGGMDSRGGDGVLNAGTLPSRAQRARVALFACYCFL